MPIFRPRARLSPLQLLPLKHIRRISLHSVDKLHWITVTIREYILTFFVISWVSVCLISGSQFRADLVAAVALHPMPSLDSEMHLT